MKKIIHFIKAMARVEYRLSILYIGDTKPRQVYSRYGRKLRYKAKHTAGIHYWSLYKKGPLGLSEREVDFG